MADSKITGLAALTTADPANDMLPIVDVSDNSMAASGTTKRISINNILACSPSATLASATITGDLTVDTSTLKVDSANNRVGIGTASPTFVLDVAGSAGSGVRYTGNSVQNVLGETGGLGLVGTVSNHSLGLYTNGSLKATIDTSGNLGIGGVPNERFNVFGTCNTFGDSRFNVAFFDTASATTGTGAGLAFSGYTNGTTAGSTFGQIKGIKENSTAGNTAGALVFSTVANGANPVERLRIDSAGNCGIGVTPSAWGGSNRAALQFPGGNAIQGSAAIGLASFNNCFNNGTNDICIANGTTYKHVVGTGYQWFIGTGTAGNSFSFGDAKMTLDASGVLLVGTTTAPNVGAATTFSGFSINGSGNNAYIASKIDNGTCGYFRRDGTDGAALNFYKANSAVGNISVTASACTFNSTSDYRLKESVQLLTGGLARVSALKPSIYKWKADGSNGEGFIAHELAEVVPAAVSGEKDALNEDGSIKPQGVDMSRVVPILVAAIQELTARVQTLEAK